MPTSDKTTQSGLVYVFTGQGKGKTSAALGTAVRALAHGWSVVWIAFYKTTQWNISEYHLPELLTAAAQQRWQMYCLGQGFYIQKPTKIHATARGAIKVATTPQSVVVDTHTPAEHQQAARAALHFAHQKLQSHPHVLVLDEVCNALADHLLTWGELSPVLDQRGPTHIVCTGRQAPRALGQYADLVSEIKNRKHPYERGQLAVAGLDF